LDQLFWGVVQESMYFGGVVWCKESRCPMAGWVEERCVKCGAALEL
jgi:hypothetical protein